jgi:ABC-type iron transport system FetAB permease component
MNTMMIELRNEHRAMVNPALATSFLFTLPASASFACGQLDVTLACLLCLATSVCNHWQGCEGALAQRVDRATVRTVAAGYVLHALWSLGLSQPVLPVYACALASAGIYARLQMRPELYLRWHFAVHVAANAGILAYVRARHALL